MCGTVPAHKYLWQFQHVNIWDSLNTRMSLDSFNTQLFGTIPTHKMCGIVLTHKCMEQPQHNLDSPNTNIWDSPNTWMSGESFNTQISGIIQSQHNFNTHISGTFPTHKCVEQFKHTNVWNSVSTQMSRSRIVPFTKSWMFSIYNCLG